MSAANQSTQSPDERIADLKQRLARRDADVAVFRAAVTRQAVRQLIMGDPLEDFFAHAEDWEIVIPVPEPPNLPQRPCLETCNEGYDERLAACAVLSSGAERRECITTVSQVYENCVKNCDARS